MINKLKKHINFSQEYLLFDSSKFFSNLLLYHSPRQTDVIQKVARTYIMSGEYQVAYSFLVHMKPVWKSELTYSNAVYYTFGSVCYFLGKFSEAIRILKRILKDKYHERHTPTFIVRYRLGQIFQRNGEIEKARKYLSLAIKETTDHSLFHGYMLYCETNGMLKMEEIGEKPEPPKLWKWKDFVRTENEDEGEESDSDSPEPSHLVFGAREKVSKLPTYPRDMEMKFPPEKKKLKNGDRSLREFTPSPNIATEPPSLREERRNSKLLKTVSFHKQRMSSKTPHNIEETPKDDRFRTPENQSTTSLIFSSPSESRSLEKESNYETISQINDESRIGIEEDEDVIEPDDYDQSAVENESALDDSRTGGSLSDESVETTLSESQNDPLFSPSFRRGGTAPQSTPIMYSPSDSSTKRINRNKRHRKMISSQLSDDSMVSTPSILHQTPGTTEQQVKSSEAKLSKEEIEKRKFLLRKISEDKERKIFDIFRILGEAYLCLNNFDLETAIVLFRSLPARIFRSGFVQSKLALCYYYLELYELSGNIFKELMLSEPWNTMNLDIMYYSSVLWHLKDRRRSNYLADVLKTNIDEFLSEKDRNSNPFAVEEFDEKKRRKLENEGSVIHVNDGFMESRTLSTGNSERNYVVSSQRCMNSLINYYVTLANCASIEGDHFSSLRHLRKILRRLEDRKHVFYPFILLGLELIEIDQFKKANTAFRSALRRTLGRSHASWSGLGMVCLRQKKFTESIYNFKRSLRLNQGSSVCITYLGIALTRIGEYRESLKCYGFAVRVNPENLFARLKMAEVYTRLKDYDEAEKILSKLASKCKDEPHIYKALGDLFVGKGDKQKALEYYQTSIQLKHSNTKQIKNAMERRWTTY